MSIFRLLQSSLMIATAAVSLAAQSSPEKLVPANPTATPVTAPADVHAPFEPKAAGNNSLQNPEQIAANDPKSLVFDPGSDVPGDNVCLTIRGIKVARDNPYSDATHTVGTSTCQLAKRFQLHTTVETVPITK